MFILSRLFKLCPTVGGLAFGRGSANVRTGDKLSNFRKTFCEQIPRMTPNRLLAVRAFISKLQIREDSFYNT